MENVWSRDMEDLKLCFRLCQVSRKTFLGLAGLRLVLRACVSSMGLSCSWLYPLL